MRSGPRNTSSAESWMRRSKSRFAQRNWGNRRSVGDHVYRVAPYGFTHAVGNAEPGQISLVDSSPGSLFSAT